MSDDAIDAMYEADLKAGTRLLEIWVTYEHGERRRVRAFVDTPEGRVTAGKRADEWHVLPTVTKVEVVPVGAGRDGSLSGRSDEPPPVPTRATCDVDKRLCEPRALRKPSGVRLCHSLDCPDKPGEPISTRGWAKGRSWPPRGRVGR